MKKTACILTGSLLLSACADIEVSLTNEDNDAAAVSMVFPKTDALSTLDMIPVRLTVKEGMTDIRVNDIPATTVNYLTSSFEQANVPLAMGANTLTVSFQYRGETHEIPLHEVTREPDYIPDINLAVPNPNDNSLIVMDSRSNSFYRLGADKTVSLIKQLHVSDTPSEQEDEDEPQERLPESMVVSPAHNTLYYVTDLDDNTHIHALNLITQTTEILYGPESQGYIDLSVSFEESLSILPNEGNAGSLFLLQQNDAPALFDLETTTIRTLNAPAPATLSGRSSRYVAAFPFTDNEMLILAKTTGSPNVLFNYKLNLAACDGQSADCELTVSGYQTTPTLNDGCPNPEGASGPMGLHPNKRHLIYERYGKPCYLDLETHSAHNLYPRLGDASEFDYGSLILAGNNLLIQEENGQHARIRNYVLADDFFQTTTAFTHLGANLTIGDPEFNVGTGREVVIDDANNRLIRLERNNQAIDKAEVDILDFSTGQWQQLGEYPATGFEIALLDRSSNRLFVYNDSGNNDDELFTIDLETGAYEIVISATEKATVNYPDFNVDSVALNEAEGLIYLARRVNSDQLPSDDYGRFSLLAYAMATGEITEVSPVNNIAEQQSMKASYDMSYDAINRRVIFYNSGSGNPLWAVDVDNGERRIFTDQENFYGPETSNARGQVIDPANNRLIVSSQDSQSLFSIDLDTGVRTMLSSSAHGNGVFFRQPIGVDLFESEATAFVADEGFDAIYQVDLITGYRVILHNPL